MSWEQFEKKELDGRLQLIAGYLANKTMGKFIVDLNCGTAPLLGWLPRDYLGRPLWGWYYGNDTHHPFVLQAREKETLHTTFEHKRDSEVLASLPGNCIDPDILLCLGYATRLNEHESQVADTVILEIVHKYRPSIVIYEYWTGLDWVKNGLHFLLDVLKGHDYVDTYRWILKPVHPYIEYGERQIMIWEALPDGVNRYLDLD